MRNLMRYKSRQIDYKNLNYDFRMKASGSINFTGHNGPFTLFKKIQTIKVINSYI